MGLVVADITHEVVQGHGIFAAGLRVTVLRHGTRCHLGLFRGRALRIRTEARSRA